MALDGTQGGEIRGDPGQDLGSGSSGHDGGTEPVRDAPGDGRPGHAAKDGQGAGLTYAVLKQPSLGWVTNNGDGTFSFDPGADFRGLAAGESRQVSFNYQASDGWGGTEAACATVTVTAADDGALAVDVSYDGMPGHGGAQASYAAAGDAPGTEAISGPSVAPVKRAVESVANAGPAAAESGHPGTGLDAPGGEAGAKPAPVRREEEPVPAGSPDEGDEGGLVLSVAPAGSGIRCYTVLAQPQEGRVRPKKDGTFDLLPGPDFPELAVGELHQVTFTCQASDADGVTNTVIAALTVTGTSDGPVACDISFRPTQGAAARQGAAALVAEQNAPTPGAPGVGEAPRANRPSGSDSGATTEHETRDAAIPATARALPPRPGDAETVDAPGDFVGQGGATTGGPRPAVRDVGDREPGSPAAMPADAGAVAGSAPASAHARESGGADGPSEQTPADPDALTDFVLSHDSVPEKCEHGTLVGQVIVQGAVDTDGFIYDLQSSAGGRFDINPRTGKITVADGARLDHRAEASHNILIQVIDRSGVSCRKTLAIKVLPAGAGRDTGLPEAGSQAAGASDAPAPESGPPESEAPESEAPESEARDPVPEAANAWGDLPGAIGGEAQERTGGDQHDILRLDGVTGGPGAGDHLLLSGNSVGTIVLDGTTVKVAFRGIERIEW
jgi:hypothetical protein